MSADLTVKVGDLQPAVRAALVNADGTAVDLTDATGVAFLMINSADENVIITGAATIDTPATAGTISYQWQAGETDVAGSYTAEWVVSWSDGDQSFPGDGYSTIEIEGDAVLEAWANASDVRKVTGAEVTDAQCGYAQAIIEMNINRVWRETDATGRDYVWLRRAVAYQADFMAANPELFVGGFGIKSIKQGDNQITYGELWSRRDELLLSPLAKVAISRLRRAYGTVKSNSAYQRSERRLPPWKPAW